MKENIEQFEIKNKNKYEIRRTNLDSYILEYKDKKINFKSDINITKKMQECTSKGKLRAISELSKKGISLKDFVIEKKINGKTFVDNTNKTEVLQTYIEEEMSIVFDEILKENLNMGLQELINDIELIDEEIEIFSEEIARALTGNTPR